MEVLHFLALETLRVEHGHRSLVHGSFCMRRRNILELEDTIVVITHMHTGCTDLSNEVLFFHACDGMHRWKSAVNAQIPAPRTVFNERGFPLRWGTLIVLERNTGGLYPC